MHKSQFKNIIFIILTLSNYSHAIASELVAPDSKANLSVKISMRSNILSQYGAVECGKLFANCLISLSVEKDENGYVDITNNSALSAIDVFPRLPTEPAGWATIGLSPANSVTISPGQSQRFQFNHSPSFVELPRIAIPIVGANTNTVFVDVQQPE